jgi:selenocysteine lyase/cysteine desulfurase
MPDAEKLAAVREALPSLGAGIYLNTGSAGPIPVESAAAVEELSNWELRTGRAHPDYFEMFLERMAEARAGVAAILAADVDSVALTHSTTDGMNIATWAVDWRPDDRAVTTTHEHAGGIGALIAVRDRFGVEVAFAEIGDGGDDERTIAAFDEAIVPGTRLVLLSHVLCTTGARLPVERIASIARDRGALVAIDGAQSVGAIPVSVTEIGADFYAVAGQKWLLGPEGTGALWASPRAIERAAMSQVGWFSFESIDLRGNAVYHRTARRFEASNHHKPSVVGLARSCGWLSMYVGLPWIHARGTTLARAAADRLAGIPGVRLLTPRERMATLVTFKIEGWPATAALTELGSRVFAVARAIVPLDAIRISVGFFNTEAEVERFARTVELIATHTPESLPPKPRLTVIGQESG